jgi:uncharacterized membrane protein (DUF373 family)
MATDAHDQSGTANSPLPSPPEMPASTAIATVREMPVVEGEHRTMTDLPAVPASRAASMPAGLRVANDIAYAGIGAIIVLLVAAALLVTVAWFIFDLTNIHTDHVASNAVRNQVIDAVANLLANIALILVLIEVLTALVSFIRTRHASPRPLLLIPLFVIMRAIILLVDQVISASTPSTTEAFVRLLAELGVLSLVGLFLSIALAFVRDPAGTVLKDTPSES